MPRKYKLRNNKLWTNRGIAAAITERDVAGISMKKLPNKYNLPIATLHQQKKEKKS